MKVKTIDGCLAAVLFVVGGIVAFGPFILGAVVVAACVKYVLS